MFSKLLKRQLKCCTEYLLPNILHNIIVVTTIHADFEVAFGEISRLETQGNVVIYCASYCVHALSYFCYSSTFSAAIYTRRR